MAEKPTEEHLSRARADMHNLVEQGYGVGDIQALAFLELVRTLKNINDQLDSIDRELAEILTLLRYRM